MTPAAKYSMMTDDEMFKLFEDLTEVAERSDHPIDWSKVAEVEEEIARRQSSTGTLF